jgi:PhzF family phenazine biosynthesis protein
VAAFSDIPEGGNLAGVCVLPAPLTGAGTEKWMQSVAARMGLSETAFLWREEGGFRLRWFTPLVEVELCGHATIASAYALRELGHVKRDEPIIFHTLGGALVARFNSGLIELALASDPPIECRPPLGLIKALGVTPRFVGKAKTDYLVEAASACILGDVAPDFELLKSVPCRGVIVTAISAARGVDFVSRFFAPAVGIDEDPVTGSAHATLGPYWSRRLGKSELVGVQKSARGGVVVIRIENESVVVGGKAVFAGVETIEAAV